MSSRPKRIIVGISGASGAGYGIATLRMLRALGYESHLIVSKYGRQCIEWETPHKIEDVQALATEVYGNANLAAPISSGTYRTDGMIIAPCSIATLSGIAHSSNENLMIRAADVCLKERRPLVLMVRETPLHLGHLRLMAQAAETGAIIMPPLPSFYQRPQSIDDLFDQTAARGLDALGIEHEFGQRWGEGNNHPAGLAASAQTPAN